jgi:hypothetical protein
MWRKETNPDYEKSRKIILKIMVPMMIFLVAFVLWAIRNEPGAKEAFLIETAKETFEGKVDSMYNDKQNHNARMAILSDKYKFGLYRDWKSKIDLGDSLSKSNGSLVVEVFKKDGSKLVLNYRALADDIFK